MGCCSIIINDIIKGNSHVIIREENCLNAFIAIEHV